MNKDQLISLLESMHDDLEKLKEEVKNNVSTNISSKDIRNKAQKLSKKWYEDFSLILPRFGLSDDKIIQYSEYFEKLLKLSLKVNRKNTYSKTLNSILSEFHNDLLVTVHKAAGKITSILHLEKILTNVSDEEREYLDEALSCAQHGFMRASVILGWCAAAHRMQKKIEQLGFDKFDQKSIEMADMSTGRFKRFNKKFQVVDLSDFRVTVFDTDMLWVIEYWGLIDANQHHRLAACHLMRSNAAHPGEAPITEENLASFYSDLRLIVFDNPKFQL